MRLRNKISIIVVVLWFVMVFITYFGSKLILSNSYFNLEQEQANNNLQRINEVIKQMGAPLNNTVTDWSVWDDTYNFVVDQNEEFKKTNLVVSAFASTDVDMLLIFNSKGQPIFTMAVDDKRSKQIDLPKELFAYISPGSLLVHQPNINSSLQGLIAIPSGILFVAAHAIVTSNNKGPVRGTLMMTKYLSKDVLEKVEKISKTNFTLYPIAEVNSDINLDKIYNFLIQNNENYLERNSQSLITGYILLKDIYSKPIAMIKMPMKRNIWQIGIGTIRYYNIAFLIYSIILVVILWYLLQKLLVERLEALKSRIGNPNNNLFDNIIESGSDEISSVASLYHQATHDPLTGLANRNLLDQAFNNHLDFINSAKNKIALLYIDIDLFKRINDTLGHEIGDLSLIAIAKKLNACLRSNDLAVRIGGDEFVILLIDIEEKQINSVVERIYKSLSQSMNIQNHKLYTTPSIGISMYPNDGNDITTLLKYADMALYKAKKSGRNNYQYYSKALKNEVKELQKKEI